MPPKDRRRNVSAPPRVEGMADDDAVVTLPRLGAPPLRLRARLAARRSIQVDGVATAMDLWRRPGGGWVAAFPRVTPDGVRPDAISAPDLATLSEAVSTALSAVPRPAPVRTGHAAWPPALAVARTLSGGATLAHAARAVQEHAAEAMACWPWNEAGPPPAGSVLARGAAATMA